MPMTEDQERWAEALAIERLHGERAKTWVAERIARSGKSATAREWSVSPSSPRVWTSFSSVRLAAIEMSTKRRPAHR